MSQSELELLTTEDGLSSNSVKTIYRDKTGYVYFGTSTGLDRYDGARMISIPFPIEHVREKCWVSGIVEAGHDRLYVGNNVGLFLFDKRTLDMKQVFTDKIDCEVTSLVRTPDGKTYVGTVSGLFVISEGKIEMVKLGLIGGFTERNIRDVSCLQHPGKHSAKHSSHYTLCVVTSRSLLLLPDGVATGGRLYAKPASCGNSRFVKVVAEDSVVYVGTSGNGVQLFDIAS
ncbi:MAG: two-component regulator propeller domain-containing protein, partial [Prevotella sp.]